MNYKEKYEKALKKAKFLKENTDGVGFLDVSKCFEEIFPELSEKDKNWEAVFDYIKDESLKDWLRDKKCILDRFEEIMHGSEEIYWS